MRYTEISRSALSADRLIFYLGGELFLVVREVGLMRLDDLAGDGLRHFFVALEVHLERALRLRHGAQIGCVRNSGTILLFSFL